MQVSSFAGFGRFHFGTALNIRSQRAPAVAPAAPAGGASRRDLDGMVRRLRRATAALQDGLDVRGGSKRPRAARAVGTSLQGLRTEPVAARLTSTTEINTVATSYTPRGPSFAGSSSSTPTIGGIYDGDQGDDTLTFTASTGGILGLTTVRLQVRDGQDQLIETVTFGFGYSGAPRTLSNGLQISLDGGSVQFGDSFEVSVSASIGSVVAADNPFNGTRNANPEFDPGLGVDAGSFQVNGVAIAVAANDSILSVLAKIDASAAGVTARFDAVTERIELQQRTPGSAADIVLGGDTSGFLAATKLAGATATPGLDDERTLPIAQVAALAGVASGTFSINGVTLALDALTDSLHDVVTRIQQQVGDVDAAFEAGARRLRLVATDGGALELDDGDTGLFTALGIATGTYLSVEGSKKKPSFAAPQDLRRDLAEFGRALEDLFTTDFGATTRAAAGYVQQQVRDAVAAAFGSAQGKQQDATEPLAAHGLTLHLDASAKRVFAADLNTLRRAMDRDALDLAALLDDDDGITGRLGDVLRTLDADVRRRFGSSVDVFA